MVHPNQIMPPISRKARVHLNIGGLTPEQQAAISGHGDYVTHEEMDELNRKNYDRLIANTESAVERAQASVDRSDVQDTMYETRTQNLEAQKARLEELKAEKERKDMGAATQAEIDNAIKTEQDIAALEGIVADDPTNTTALDALEALRGQSLAKVDEDVVVADTGTGTGSLEVPGQTPEIPEGAEGMTPAGEQSIQDVIALAEVQDPKGTAEKKEKIMGWMESLGLGDYFDKGQIANMVIQYLGSRLLGYDHGASANWAIKQYGASVQKAQESRSAAAAKNEERAFELYKEGVITLEQYNNMVATGKIPTPDTTTSAGGAQVQGQILKAHGIDPSKSTVKFVKSTDQAGSPAIVEAWFGAGTYWVPDDKGGLKPFDITGFEKWTSEQHAEVNVQKNLKTHMNSFADDNGYRSEVRVTEDGKTVTKTEYAISPTAFSTGYINYLKETYGANAYIYANTPAGRSEAEAMYKAGVNFKTKTGKPIENWGGFFRGVNMGIYGADGHVNVELLGTTPEGGYTNPKHFTRLEPNLAAFRNKHQDLKTDGAAMKVALDAFSDPKTDAERDLVKKVNKMTIPEGSSPAMEFVILYFQMG